MGIRNKMKKANKEHRTALVLEGGGLRGAYTAGALSWLVDNGISFDNAYGISTGAVYLLTYMKGSVDELRDFSVDYIRDRNVIGALALLRSGKKKVLPPSVSHTTAETQAPESPPLSAQSK